MFIVFYDNIYRVLLHKGEYRKGVKVGVWNIYKEGSDTV